MPFYIDPRIGGWTIGIFVEKCWLIRATCSGCGREGRLQAAELRQLPPEVTAEHVVSRLKCERCGGSEGYADFLQDRTATMHRDAAEHQRRMEEAKGRGQ